MPPDKICTPTLVVFGTGGVLNVRSTTNFLESKIHTHTYTLNFQKDSGVRYEPIKSSVFYPPLSPSLFGLHSTNRVWGSSSKSIHRFLSFLDPSEGPPPSWP